MIRWGTGLTWGGGAGRFGMIAPVMVEALACGGSPLEGSGEVVGGVLGTPVTPWDFQGVMVLLEFFFPG